MDFMKRNVLRRGAALLLALVLMVPTAVLPAEAADPNVTMDWSGDVENNTLDVVVGETVALDLTVRVAGEDPNDPYKLGMSPNSHTWTDAGEIRWRVYFTEDTTLRPADGTFRFIRLEVEAKQVGSQDITIKFHPFGSTSSVLLEKTLTVNVTPKVTLDRPEIITYRLENAPSKTVVQGVSIQETEGFPASGGTLSYEWKSDSGTSLTVADYSDHAYLTPRASGEVLKATVTVTWTPDAGNTAASLIKASATCRIYVYGVTMEESVTLNRGGTKNITVGVRSPYEDASSNYEGNWDVTFPGDKVTITDTTNQYNISYTAALTAAADASTAKDDGSVTFRLERNGAKQFDVASKITVTDDTPAAVKVTGVTVSPQTLSLKEGESSALTATVSPANATDKSVTWRSSDEGVATVGISGLVRGVSAGTATITVTTADGGFENTCTVTVTKPVAVTGVTLDQTALTIIEKQTDGLVATVLPENAGNKNVTWTSSDPTVATVDQKGAISALKPGKTTITVTTEDGGKTASCEVTVNEIPVAISSITVSPPNIEVNRMDSRTWEVWATVSPTNATYEKVEWSSDDPRVAAVSPDSGVTKGRKAIVTAVGPGTTVINAKAGDKVAQCEITVSGITLSSSALTMMEGKSTTLSVSGSFGEARTGTIKYESSDTSVVAVSGSRLTARALGTATVTVTRGNYSAECVVTVVEDTSGLVDAGRITAGEKLGFNDTITIVAPNSFTIRSELNARCLENTGYTLSYITNLSVRTEQGTMYYNYLSEGDTGAGVGMTEQYYYNPIAGQMPIAKLTFVPKNDYSGYVEISYTGYSSNRQSFKGAIRVLVGAMNDVYYSTNAGRHINFRASDFNATCRGLTGRELSYVTFTLPLSSRGTLYYNYTGQDKYTEKVTANTPYRYTSSPNLNNVSFVPADDYTGTFSIIYQGVDSAGAIFSGRVTITVNDPIISDQADLHFKSERGKQVIFGLTSFNDACRAVTGETLDYVRFTLPPAGSGTLYHNYRSASSPGTPVTSGTNYSRNGVPALSGVSFISALTAPGEVAIDYMGFGTGGSTYVGTVYIELDDASQQNIYYTVESGNPVTFLTDDFNNACRTATGAELNYVRLQLPTPGEGQLYYRYNKDTGSYDSRVSSSASYYRTGGNRQIGNVSFVAKEGYTGTVTIPYTGYNSAGKSFKGNIVIQVNAPAPRNVTYTGTAASPIRLSASSFRTVCNEVLKDSLSYVQFNELPSSSLGRLYTGYSGFNTGTQVNSGMKFYVSGSPGIDQLSFVVRGGVHTGTAVISYTAVSVTGQQVNGQVRITIQTPSSSRYFTDMAGYRASLASVDYLYENKVTTGMSAGRFAPRQNIRRCDFVLMLCRIYGFNSTVAANFPDVPADAYYARAVAAAQQLGIVSGNGVGFNPNGTLTRQDAMVIIHNTMTIMGWSTAGTPTNLDGFADSAAISGYARSAVGTLVQMGVVKADADGRLRPKDNITRAEVALILHSLMTM